VPPHARAGQNGRGHRFAAYPRCSADQRTDMTKWLQKPWIIFILTLAYSCVAFDLYWAHGPTQLGLTIGGELALPVAYGLMWLALSGRDVELGLRAMIASGACVGALLVICLAHYPPFLEWSGLLRPGPVRGRQESRGALEAIILIGPALLGCVVSAWQSRAMARKFAVRRGRRTRG
jgi:hypothetical protein